jgi:hypothetical protein
MPIVFVMYKFFESCLRKPLKLVLSLVKCGLYVTHRNQDEVILVHSIRTRMVKLFCYFRRWNVDLYAIEHTLFFYWYIISTEKA